MIQQTIFPFKIKTTEERLTAHGGWALMAEFNHGIGLRELTDQYLPGPGSNRGFEASEVVDAVVLMLQGGRRSLEDLRELKNEEGLMKLMGRDEIPEPDTVGDWLRRMGDPKTGQMGLEGLDRVRDKINERVLKKGVYLQCKRRMPRGKRIGYYRGDSASYQAGLFNQLETDGVRYGVTADQDKAGELGIGLI